MDESDADLRTVEVQDLIRWLVEEGYSEPRTYVEVVDPDTGRVLAVAEAFWEAGLQEGLVRSPSFWNWTPTALMKGLYRRWATRSSPRAPAFATSSVDTTRAQHERFRRRVGA